jgi:hypothetical protein
MSKKFSLDQLTEGIRQRNLGGQNKQLVEKWSRTGLLRGLEGVKRENMARLLENQASQVLKEASSVSTGGGNLTSSGDLRGFTNIAFPIVRRVFGGLIANELVSIQPMSLPSGLLFYLDYTYGTPTGNLASQGAAYNTGSSIYSVPTGKGVQSGSQAVGGLYDLAGQGYSRVHSTFALAATADLLASGAVHGTNGVITAGRSCQATGSDAKYLQFDPQILNSILNNDNTGPGHTVGNGAYTLAAFATDNIESDWDSTMVKEVTLLSDVFGTRPNTLGNIGNDTDGNAIQGGTGVLNVRRLNQLGTLGNNNVFSANAFADPSDSRTVILMVLSGVMNDDNSTNGATIMTVSYPLGAALNTSANASSLVIPAFESDFAATPSPAIPEIDIKIEALAVVAETRKLRARWSPELAQDLNAYHSLDAEVELTQILSEQIALEIDREVLNDLLTQATAANYYWSRAPGKFLNKETGAEELANNALSPGPAWRGTVREWYETLIETCIDVGNQIHRKTLRGSANFIVVGPDVATILESSVFYKPNYTLDGDGQVSGGMVIGAEKVGSLSNRFTVYKDPYFPRNKVLVGYKGGSYLETGYVYAPYVPLIVTPTIFAPEDFTPRKGVMTRYGKKMVRADFYGTVTCADMSII